jgi:hypothetical protein
MNYDAFLSSLTFRFVPPHAARDDAGWFSIARRHGSRARLLGLPGFPLDLFNPVLPEREPSVRATLRDLCSIPKMSTFAIGAIVNQAVARMPPEHSFVNVGVWNGFTFLCGLAGNSDRACIGIDNFSQFGGPRDEFIERFNSRKSPRHLFYDMDYVEYFTRDHQGPIGVYIYDGEHSYDNQLNGLRAAEPYFADDCIIVVDDTNWCDPWRGTMDFVTRSRHEYRVLLDHATSGNGHPSFWNGIMVLQRSAHTRGATTGLISSAERRRPEVAEPKLPAVNCREALSPEQRRCAPLVSLIIVHSAPQADLEAALASARALIYPNVELILVDTATQGTERASLSATAPGSRQAKVVVLPPDSLTHVPAHRLTAAFEAGLSASHGQWVAFVDSERTLVPMAIEIGLNFRLDTLGCTHSQTDWYEQSACLLMKLTQIAAPNQTVILVDDAQLGITGTVAERTLLPFLERDGQYNGQPADDACAIRELERLRGLGAHYIAFAWPCFWWLDHYAAFHKLLRHRFACVADNQWLHVFALQ